MPITLFDRVTSRGHYVYIFDQEYMAQKENAVTLF